MESEQVKDEKKELWDLFTVREEYKAKWKDAFDRSTYWASGNRDVFTPRVSEYLLRNGLSPRYPDNRRFAVCLTHDIDTLFHNTNRGQLVKEGVKNLLKLNLPGFGKTIRKGYTREVIREFHVKETFKIEKRYDARSSFYFLSLSDGEQDFNYDVSEISGIFDEIHRNKGEIGLHGGHLAFNDASKIKHEKERLEAAVGRKVEGYRNHYLRFETPSTWEHLESSGFMYDTTFGYADCVGFRNGMCHPFQPFSLEKNDFLDIIELPLTIMECTLWRYMRMNEEMQLEICKRLIDKVAEAKGVLTLLWHNTEMQGQEGRLYDAILKHAYERGAWLTTGGEIARHWRENGFHETAKDILRRLMD